LISSPTLSDDPDPVINTEGIRNVLVGNMITSFLYISL
jgi:hypothetical protein